MSKAYWIICCSAFLLTTACGPDKSNYLTPEFPRQMSPCPATEITSYEQQSYHALMASLSYKGWVIERADINSGIIVARICESDPFASADFLSRPLDECLVMRFEIVAGGEIRSFNPKEVRYYSKIAPEVGIWVHNLEKAFSQSRCYSRDELSRWSTSKGK